MTQSRTALYKAQIAKLKERYAGKMDILCGLEWDLYSDDDPTQYDYWIGSTHYVRGPKTGKYYEIDWREEDLRACIDDDFDGDALAWSRPICQCGQGCREEAHDLGPLRPDQEDQR